MNATMPQVRVILLMSKVFSFGAVQGLQVAGGLLRIFLLDGALDFALHGVDFRLYGHVGVGERCFLVVSESERVAHELDGDPAVGVFVDLLEAEPRHVGCTVFRVKGVLDRFERLSGIGPGDTDFVEFPGWREEEPGFVDLAEFAEFSVGIHLDHRQVLIAFVAVIGAARALGALNDPGGVLDGGLAHLESEVGSGKGVGGQKYAGNEEEQGQGGFEHEKTPCLRVVANWLQTRSRGWRGKVTTWFI